MSIFRWSAAPEAETLKISDTERSRISDAGKTVTWAHVRLMSTSNYLHVNVRPLDK